MTMSAWREFTDVKFWGDVNQHVVSKNKLLLGVSHTRVSPPSMPSGAKKKYTHIYTLSNVDMYYETHQIYV